MKRNYFEVLIGAFVLTAAFTFFLFSFRSANLDPVRGYHLSAKFDNSDGIAKGSDVKISGVKVGVVQNQILGVDDFRAKLDIMMDPAIQLPTDSSAKVSSEGLLGSKYVAISPGAEEEFLKDGDEIVFTQSSVNFEDLLGKFIFSAGDKASSDKGKAKSN